MTHRHKNDANYKLTQNKAQNYALTKNNKIKYRRKQKNTKLHGDTKNKITRWYKKKNKTKLHTTQSNTIFVISKYKYISPRLKTKPQTFFCFTFISYFIIISHFRFLFLTSPLFKSFCLAIGDRRLAKQTDQLTSKTALIQNCFRLRIGSNSAIILNHICIYNSVKLSCRRFWVGCGKLGGWRKPFWQREVGPCQRIARRKVRLYMEISQWVAS